MQKANIFLTTIDIFFELKKKFSFFKMSKTHQVVIILAWFRFLLWILMSSEYIVTKTVNIFYHNIVNIA